MFHFDREDDYVICFSGDEEIYRTRNFSICYDDSGDGVAIRYTILKHGDIRHVSDYYEKVKEYSLDVKILKDNHFPEDLLTQVVNTSGSLFRLLDYQPYIDIDFSSLEVDD